MSVMALAGLVISAVLWPRPEAQCTIQARLRLQPVSQNSAHAPSENDLRELVSGQATRFELQPTIQVTTDSAGATVSLELVTRSPYGDQQRMRELIESIAHAAPAFLVQRQLRPMPAAPDSDEERVWQELRDKLFGYVTVVRRAVNDQVVMPGEVDLEPAIPVSTEATPSTPLNPRWLDLSQQLEQEREQLLVLGKRYTTRHPAMVAVSQRIASLAGELERIPMLTQTPSVPEPGIGTATEADGRLPGSPDPERQWQEFLTDLEDAERSLYTTLDDFAAARADNPPREIPPPAMWFVESSQPPAVVARHGGLRPENWLALTLVSLAVSFGMFGASLRRQSGLLEEVQQLATAWDTRVLAQVGQVHERRRAARTWYATGYKVARTLALWVSVAAILLALFDPSFLGNLIHDPRLALAEAWGRIWVGGR